MKISRVAAASLLIALALITPKAARAGRVSEDTIALFPKETGEFGYADLKKARTMKWFPQLEQQVLPDRFKQFEKFLAAAGVDPETQVTDVAWGLVADNADANSATSVPSGEEIVGIALGNFNPDSAGAYFKQQKLPILDVRGYSLYPFGTGSGPSDLVFMFFDSNKAAFGSRSKIEKMIGLRFGDDQGLLYNDAIFPLINEANGNSTVWLVLNAAYTRLAMQQLSPEVQQFPEAAKLATRMKNMIINVNASSDVDAKFQAICGSTDDANTLGQLLQLGLMYKQYQAKNDNPDLAQLLGQAHVSPAGDRVIINMSVTDEQMSSLIRNNSFALKM
jgi:hypothetical protein